MNRSKTTNQNPQKPMVTTLVTADDILSEHLSEGQDHVEMERHLNELMIHYLRPMGEHEVSQEYAKKLYTTYISIKELLKEIDYYKKQQEALQSVVK